MSWLLLNEDNVTECHIFDDDVLEFGKGQVLVQIVKMAFTSNVISYALGGKSLRYFDFFPTGKPGMAAAITWGIAQVVASRDERIRVGERLYGLFPMKEYLVLNVSRVTDEAFLDLSDHRKDLSTIYNTYTRVSNGLDHLYSPETEDYMIILRPLFLTSWLLKDFAEEQLAKASKKQVILTSASSKTSIGLAYLLKYCSKANISVVGLTSKGNVDFVKQLNTYDRVVLYNDVGDAFKNQDKSVQTHIIDMAGNGETLHAILASIPDAKCSLVGATDWSKGMANLPGKFFFAPAQGVVVTKRLGQDNFNKAVANDWFKFIDHIKQHNWFQVSHTYGPTPVLQTYKAALKGINPKEASVVSMSSNPTPKL